MKLGAAMFFTDYSMSPGELASALEERGFEFGVVARALAHPAQPRIGLPERRRAAEEILRRHGSVRGADGGGRGHQDLKVGTGICLITQRDTIQTAKLVASIDQLSGGRFLFGIGNGWNKDEMANHGTTFETRHKLAREKIEAMKAIWTKSKPEYHGEMVNFDPMMTWPKPIQKPHPPIWVGGAFPYGARRAIRYGDGWMPHRVRPTYANVRDMLPEFRKLAAEANRDSAGDDLGRQGGRGHAEGGPRRRRRARDRQPRLGQVGRDPAAARSLGEARREGRLTA